MVQPNHQYYNQTQQTGGYYGGGNGNLGAAPQPSDYYPPQYPNNDYNAPQQGYQAEYNTSARQQGYAAEYDRPDGPPPAGSYSRPEGPPPSHAKN